eukprot:495046-Pyramimonas_sp.AAC.1
MAALPIRMGPCTRECCRAPRRSWRAICDVLRWRVPQGTQGPVIRSRRVLRCCWYVPRAGQGGQG